MKANELVEKFGWIAVKHDFSVYFKDEKIGTIQILTHEGEYIEVNGEDLKRLVESHDLVEKVGGMDKAKMLLRMRIAAELYESADEIEKAIADVEACKGVL